MSTVDRHLDSYSWNDFKRRKYWLRQRMRGDDSLIEQPKKTKKTADEVLIDACEKLEIDPQYKQAIQDEIKKFHEIGNN